MHVSLLTPALSHGEGAGHRHASRELLEASQTAESIGACSYSVVQRDSTQTQNGIIDIRAHVPLSALSASATIVPQPAVVSEVSLDVKGQSCDDSHWGGDAKTHVLSTGHCNHSIANISTCALAGSALKVLFTRGESTVPVQSHEATITASWGMFDCWAKCTLITWAAVMSELVNVIKVYAATEFPGGSPWAALRQDGSVVTWGRADCALCCQL